MKFAVDRVARSVLSRVNTKAHKPYYAYVSRHAGEGVLFLNWSYEEDPPMATPLEPDDEYYRYPIQLYHATASQDVGLTGKQVLEVGCGHGGGASYLTRTFKPKSYTGLDLNASGIEFCRRRHQLAGLEFVEGNAEDLPFPAEAFDAVINVESSHLYPHFDRFLDEVTRVLRPGGTFLYTDMWQWFQVEERERDLTATGMQIANAREITTEVLRGADLNISHWEAAWDSPALRFVRPIVPAPTKRNPLHRDMVSGKQTYRMYCLTKL
jgi:fatty-acid O-methyltransferase